MLRVALSTITTFFDLFVTYKIFGVEKIEDKCSNNEFIILSFCLRTDKHKKYCLTFSRKESIKLQNHNTRVNILEIYTMWCSDTL
jgi:hypothetical protein